MTALLPLAIVVPLGGAAVTLLLGRHLAVQRVVVAGVRPR